jgi:hypothetical protein
MIMFASQDALNVFLSNYPDPVNLWCPCVNSLIDRFSWIVRTTESSQQLQGMDYQSNVEYGLVYKTR